MADHNDLGRLGEDLAVQMLQRKGYTIRERNWSFHGFETDIIALDRDTIVFVEVKTRRAGGIGRPEDAVDMERQRRLCIGAGAYIKHYRINNPWRMDVVAIVVDSEGHATIDHIEDAFMPQLRTIHAGTYTGAWRYKKPFSRRK
ncbi:MAG: YraN family protein [Paludibacteraceae bacterium]|nr:YraN family protein [Paludibacteraceae bacterium]